MEGKYTDLTFFTNESGRTLLDRFNAVVRNEDVKMTTGDMDNEVVLRIRYGFIRGRAWDSGFN